jgi:salicylate hydroxylase
MSATTPLRCVIAGAGLGGLSAAIGLRRVGHEVVVLEQAPELGEVGAGIQMAPNASRLLGAWGVVDAFRPQAVRAEAALRRRYADGSVLGEVEMGAALEEVFGAAYWCLHRVDLHSALVAVATDPDGDGQPVEIHLDTAVTDVLSTGPDEARVATSTGEEFAGDIVIGADGIRSVIRHALFGPQPHSFSGRVTNRHVIDLADLGDDPDLVELLSRPAQNIWLGPGGSALTHPLRAGTGVYLGVTKAGVPESEAVWSQAIEKDEELRQLATWDPRLTRLVEAAPSVTAYGLHDSEPMDQWSIGRVVLMGDACHAMLPFQAQGAGQSVEDGAVLAAELLGTPSDEIEAAIARYEDARKPRTARVQAASRGNAELWHMQSGPEQEERDRNLAQGSGDFESYEWLWTARPGGAPEAAPASTAPTAS